jgi:hypothetical protein
MDETKTIDVIARLKELALAGPGVRLAELAEVHRICQQLRQVPFWNEDIGKKIALVQGSFGNWLSDRGFEQEPDYPAILAGALFDLGSALTLGWHLQRPRDGQAAA